jgi:hypothetical protein
VAFGGQDLSYVEPGAALPYLVNMMGDPRPGDEIYVTIPVLTAAPEA